MVALSYGERGESGELWTEPGQTMQRVKAIRQEEASQAAAILGASFQCPDWGDYPLDLTQGVRGSNPLASTTESRTRTAS